MVVNDPSLEVGPRVVADWNGLQHAVQFLMHLDCDSTLVSLSCLTALVVVRCLHRNLVGSLVLMDHCLHSVASRLPVEDSIDAAEAAEEVRSVGFQGRCR